MIPGNIRHAIDVYRKERQSEKTEDTLRKLWRAVEQSADLVMITDREGVIEYVNPAFEAVSGYTPGELMGQTPRVLKSGQQNSELYKEMWQTILAGNVFRCTMVNRKKNGDVFVAEKTVTPLRDSEGRITHFISNDRDITDRRRLENQLQQAQKMDAIGRLAGGVAHDFNNLLMVISSYAELMLDSLAPHHPLRRNVDEIQKASRRAADLTRQLLAFGRKQMQSLQLLDLNLIIEDINKMLPRLIGEDIELVFVPGEKLGKVKADPVQIEQVLMNLAANARDAMPKGGRLVIETASLRLDDAYVAGTLHRSTRPLCCADGHGFGIGNRARAPVAYLRALLHDQGGRQRHRAWPGHGLRHRETEQRFHLGVQRARHGNYVQDLFTPGATGEACAATSRAGRRLPARLRNSAAGGG